MRESRSSRNTAIKDERRRSLSESEYRGEISPLVINNSLTLPGFHFYKLFI